MNKPTIVFILNPLAGGGGKRINKEEIRTLWNDHEVVFLESLQGREKQISAFLEAGVRDFVVGGGDGTVNEVASVLMNTPARLGILPLGSGNGLARDLGLPMEVRSALEVIREGRVQTIDVGTLNGLPFFCTAGIGFDAICAHDFASGRHSRGVTNYIRVVLRNYFTHRPVEVKMDGVVHRFFSLTFANAGQFGNNAYIAPAARLDDGYLDCAMLLPHPKSRFLALGWHLLRKSVDQLPYFRSSRFKSCTLSEISDNRIHIDGEAVKVDSSTIDVKIIENALHVFSGENANTCK